MSRPAARSEGLVVETLEGEVLVYDTARNRAHCLTPVAAAVWRACDGQRTLKQIAEVAGVDEKLTMEALRSLSQALLLREPLPKAKPTRRQALAAAAIVPLVLSISAPAAAQAASCIARFNPCNPTGTPCCAPRRCIQFFNFGFFCV